MPRPILNARLHLLGLILVWAAWMGTTGLVLGTLALRADEAGGFGRDQSSAAAFTLLLTALAWVLFNSRLPELAQQGRVWPTRAVGAAGGLGAVGLLAGVRAVLRTAENGTALADGSVMALRGAFGLLGLCLIALAPAGATAVRPAFLTSRHASDIIARRSLLTAAGHALLVALAAGLALAFLGGRPTPELARFGAAYGVGFLGSFWQRYPQRAMSFIVIGGLLAAVALLAAWIAPAAAWPILLLCFALGLGHAPPRNDLIANLAPEERIAGLSLMALAMAVGGLAGIALSAAFPTATVLRPLRFAIGLALAAAAIHGYLRELIEQAIEPVLAIMNPIRAYGPGLRAVPTRGPVLIIANHCAWFDPLWIAKVMPLRLRPLMTSKFYDLPVISWLMRRVFHTIRVQEAGFRREAPEIQEAIAALDRGENVLIFPEGWLKRKDEQSVRRFGQGVYQILRDKPGTPVIVCWIEGNWGSYTSYWNGPPTKNKKFDVLRLIRIGISKPQVLGLEMLHDHLATRRHLMLACLRARTHLGLPELPPPPFATDEETEDNGAPPDHA